MIYSLQISQVDWVTMNFVPFAERCVEMVTDMYKTTAQHPTVINSRVLQSIIKVREMMLSHDLRWLMTKQTD